MLCPQESGVIEAAFIIIFVFKIIISYNDDDNNNYNNYDNYNNYNNYNNNKIISNDILFYYYYNYNINCIYYY